MEATTPMNPQAAPAEADESIAFRRDSCGDQQAKANSMCVLCTMLHIELNDSQTYLPNSNVAGYEANTRICDVAPYSECNPNFGASVGRGSFNFTSGHWNTVAQRVRMNDPGKDNGEIEVYANGYSKFFGS